VDKTVQYRCPSVDQKFSEVRRAIPIVVSHCQYESSLNVGEYDIHSTG